MHNGPSQGPLVSSAVPATTVSFSSAYENGELDEFFDCPRPPHTVRPQGGTARPRSELAAALKSEALRLGADEAVLERADALAHPASQAVVTGQQAGLLLGPNFTLSKTATATRVAARLDSEAAPAVPVFWLASQDHDVEEVNHTWLLDLDETLHRLDIGLPANVPTGQIPMQAAWLKRISGALAHVRSQPEHLADVQEKLTRAAALADTWSDFFAAFYYAVLGADAPLLLDPVRPGIAPLFRDVLTREIEAPQASTEAINRAGDRLHGLGFKPQLGRGKDATNLFITMREDGLPRRQLLRYSDGLFHSGSSSWSRQDLLALLETEPQRITPAAGLRPVTQDAVLPTAAFVVGPGELGYIAQLRDVYRLHGVMQPTIWPRAEVTIIEPPVRRILSGFGLTAQEYLADPEGHEQRAQLQQSGAATQFAGALSTLAGSQTELNEALLDIDPSLTGAVNRHAERLRLSLEHLEKRTAAALKKRDSTLTRQHARLRSQLLPDGSKQERLLSPVSFFLKFGIGPVLRIFRQVPESGSVWPEI